MNLSCAAIERRLPDVVLGDLDENARADLLDHADNCKPCSEALTFQRRLYEAIEHGSRPTPPPVYFEGVLAQIHMSLRDSPPEPLQPSPLRSVRRLSREAAATAILLMFIGIWTVSSVSRFNGSSVFDNMMSRSPYGAIGGASDANAASPLSGTSRPERAVAMVWSDQAGWIRADSGLLALPAAERRMLGIASTAHPRGWSKIVGG